MPDFDEVYEGIIRDLYQRATTESPQRTGNYLQAANGQFLGKLTSNRFDAEGIFNEFGTYGSKYSSNSIFNPYGPYGSKFAAESPWNPYALNPPQIYLNGRPSGKLTKNRYIVGGQAQDPDEFLARIREEPRFRF